MLTACGGGDEKEADKDDDVKETTTSAAVPEETTTTVPEGTSFVAEAKGPMVAVYDEPDRNVIQSLANPIESGAPLVFLVDGTDVADEWLQVYLPVKPNGSKGWVKASSVKVSPNQYHIKIEMGAYKLTLTKAGKVEVETGVGLGKGGRETPAGTYYIKELYQPPDPNGAYGPYAYGLSAFTESTDPQILEDFPGGVIGLHGTNKPDSIGNNESSGCIRMANDVITEMAGYLPLGTPVEIVA